MEIPAVGAIEAWVEVLEETDGLVSFRSTFVFDSDGTILTSDSTLRFRSSDELAESLVAGNFTVRDIRDALIDLGWSSCLLLNELTERASSIQAVTSDDPNRRPR